MLAFIMIAFLVGGLCGMLGMAILACGSKVNLMRDNHVLGQRLDFLENEGEKVRYKPVKDPRPQVHSMVS